MAVLDVKDLVEEATDMESKTVFLLLRKCLSIFVFEDPTALRECELEFVTIICCLIGPKNRSDFRNIKMTDAYKLIIDLLLLCLKLHLVWKWLPFATSAYSKVLAERLQAMF